MTVEVIHLTVLRKSLRLFEPTGRRVTMPLLRLTCLLRFASRDPWTDCWLDTGSPFSVFGERHWRRFEDDIEWVAEPSRGMNDLGRVGGGAYPFRFGKVAAEVLGSQSTEPVDLGTIVAMMLSDGHKLTTPLLGLWGGVLAGRQPVVEADLASARLEAA